MSPNLVWSVCFLSSELSSVESPVKCTDDIRGSSVISSVYITDETHFPPIIDNINIKQEESLARTRESPPTWET